MSNIHVLPREEALGFVANIMNEEEAVGVELQQPATSRRFQNGGRLRGRVGNGNTKTSIEEEEEEEEEEDAESMGEDAESMDEDDREEEVRPSVSGGKKRRVEGAGRR